LTERTINAPRAFPPKRMQEFGIYPAPAGNGLIVTEPMGYLDFLSLQKRAKFVLTDSGGVQEETTFFNVPCLTLRENTERPITVAEGTNRLIGLEKEAILRESAALLDGRKSAGRVPKFWDGQVADRILKVLS
jgi:UDP-N-acetylglucosamine 2-epimerase (non-hydrolysing)